MDPHGEPPASHQDGYQGISWSDRAKFDVLGAVLDPADPTGRKNRFLDLVHRMAVGGALDGLHFDRALDFGCGTGRFLSYLAERSSETYALDRTPEMLHVAKTVWPMPEERYVCWREPRLPFPDRHFDLVLSVGVLCTMSRDDLEGVATELGRVSADDGMAVLIEQSDHGRSLTPEGYRETFGRAGFEMESARPIRASKSPLMSLATRPWLPGFLVPALARAEMMRMKNAAFLPTTTGYWDHRYVLRRRRRS